MVENDAGQTGGGLDAVLASVEVGEDAIGDLPQGVAGLKPGHFEHEQRVIGGGFLPGLDGLEAGICAAGFAEPTGRPWCSLE